MTFTEPAFVFLFLPVAVLLFYGASRRFGPAGGLAVLFLASVIFYGLTGWRNLGLLAASTLINFTAGRLLLELGDQRRGARLALAWGAQLWNFGALFLFKYLWVSLALREGGMSLAEVAVPVGISFYTFHQAAFLMDAYNREPCVAAHLGRGGSLGERARALLRYTVFIWFFPQLVIGPITYFKEFQASAAARTFGRLSWRNIEVGLTLIAIGLFKKVVIADGLAGPVDRAFDVAAEGGGLDPWAAWTGGLGFYAQLYFDFSGYSDMALGAARLFAIRLPINFFSPLKAVGIIDFYRRWHMTLTRVISRFLFMPLSLMGSRFAAKKRLANAIAKPLSLWLPLLINFEIIGLWHGARETFIVFGLVHGAWYILETEARRMAWWKAWRARTSKTTRALIGRCLFLVPMVATFALFRSDSLGAFGHLVHEALVFEGDGSIGVPPGFVALLASSMAIIYLAPNSIEILRRVRPGIMTYDNPQYWSIVQPRWRSTWGWAGVCVVFLGAAAYFMIRQKAFLYAGF